MPKQHKKTSMIKNDFRENSCPQNSENERNINEYVLLDEHERSVEKQPISAGTLSAISSAHESTFEAISWEWLRTQQPELKVSSYAKYENLLSSYILPFWGAVPIQAIDHKAALKFSRNLLLTGGARGVGLSPRTVNSIISVLKNVLIFAAQEKGLCVADIGNVSVRQPQTPMRILSLIEQETLCMYLFQNLDPCHLGILLCVYTGMRIGEICALKWGDIYLGEQYLYIHSSMQRIQTKKGSDRKTEVVIQSPKSECSVRKIPIPNGMLSILIASKKRNDAFLLTGNANHFMEPRCLENRFKKVTKTCGIPNINFHALRHTFATRCVELGFDIKCLSEILGHASVNITLNRYVHPSMDLKQKNMNRLSIFLSTN